MIFPENRQPRSSGNDEALTAVPEGDCHWMQYALELAGRAEAEGEVPVGAVLVLDGQVIGEGWNRNIGACDPAAHAEILALRDAGQHVGNHRLVGSTLYVTLEPCAMCLMACVHARIERLVYGATDPKTGAAGGSFDLLGASHHNHELMVSGGVLAEKAGDILRSFFRQRRS